MSNLLRSYRRNILRAALSERGAKQLNKKVTFSDKDVHKSRIARAFFDLMHRKEKA